MFIKNWGRKFLAISLAEVILALVIMSLVILASKNITASKFKYAKRVRAYAAWTILSKMAGAVVSDGVILENTYNYKMISPIFSAGVNGTYLPDIYNDVGQKSVKINGGFVDGVSEYFNSLDSTVGPSFNSSDCSADGYFNNQTPTMTLSNGMALYISPTAYSFGMSNVAVTNLATDNFKNYLKCINGSIVSDCNQSEQLSQLCSAVENKAQPIAPWSTTYSGNATTYLRNATECPACANTGQTVAKYFAVQIFEYIHVLKKNLDYCLACGPNSNSFLDQVLDRFLNGSYYVVYVDTDGPRAGTNTLNDDVLEFYVLLSGKVLPVSPIMKNGDYLLANLYSQTTAKTEILSSGIAMPRAMCNKKFANNVFSYYSTNFIPLRNYCPSDSVECPSSASECYYKALKSSVSVRGKGK